MALGFDTASNRNEYQENFLGVNAAGAYGWQPYHLHVLIVLKSGSLKFLKKLGPVQVFNGIALPDCTFLYVIMYLDNQKQIAPVVT